MPRTTEDCKQFLAETFKKHPRIIVDIYGDDYALADSQKPGKWRRDAKMKVVGSDYVHGPQELVEVLNENGIQTERPAADFTCLRKFSLDPASYDSGVAFLVLEDPQGGLHLGEYVGD